MTQIITTLRTVVVTLLGPLVVPLILWPGIAAFPASNELVDRQPDAEGNAAEVVVGSPTSEGWAEQLMGFVVVQEGIAGTRKEPGVYGAYVGQIVLVRNLYDRGDWRGAYVAMNRFMDMLEVRDGGITERAAEATWDYCYVATPPALHDVRRHRQWWDKHVEWDKFFWEE